MVFKKKWTAIALTAVLAASNLAAPFSPVRALGAQTGSPVSMEEAAEETSDPAEAALSAAAPEAEGSGSFGQEDGSLPAGSREDAEDVLPDAEANAEADGSEQEAVPYDAAEETEASAESDGAQTPEAGYTGAVPAENNDENEAGIPENDPSDAQEEDMPSDAMEDAIEADVETQTGEAGEDPADASPADSAAADDGMPAAEDPQADQPAGGQMPAEKSGAPVQDISLPEGSARAAKRSFERDFPLPDDMGATDNDDLFAAYVNRELELTGNLRADTGDVVSTPRTDKNYAAGHLTGNAHIVYGILLDQIRQAAAGERSDTLFTIKLADLDLGENSWSASELGLDSLLDENGRISEEATKAMDAMIGLSDDAFWDVILSLRADSPCDLYWYDIERGYDPYSWYYSTRYDENGTLKIYYSEDFEIGFPVSADYSPDGSTGTFQIDPTAGQSVQQARENAQAIVDRYAKKTDLEKLDGYRKEICDLTSYNEEASEDEEVPYGDPWQLLWIFDGDPETTVVCEGYSKGFQYLCDLSTFGSVFRECICVTGWMDGGPHMWNIVALQDGRSYLVDLTNCDEGMIGCDYDEETRIFSPGRILFLVGTGPAASPAVYAQGSLDGGYSFYQLEGLTYIYDDDTRATFDDEILTLAAGRLDVSSGSSGEPAHAHIFDQAVDAVPSTCLLAGHSAGHRCSLCGIFDSDVKAYPLGEHTPGEWKLTTAPTYTKKGVETAACTLCGKTLTRSVDKLIRPTGLILSDSEIVLRIGNTWQLDADLEPYDAADPGIKWSSSDESIASVDENGLVKAKKYGDVTITATIDNEIEEISQTCWVYTLFKDVYNPGKSYYLPVYWAVDAGITVCTVNFRPENPVTRGEFVAFLWRFFGKPKSTAKIRFTDVNADTQFYQAIRWAVDVGIIKGFTDGSFRPTDQVTRGQTATMLWRAAGEPAARSNKSPFSDLKPSSADSYKAILWGADNGIIKGSGGKFLKDDGCTRGQVVTFLYRFEEYLERYYD